MACPNRNRHRPRTVAFRLTDEEFLRLEQRVKITGEVKGDYLRVMALTGEVNINVGKFRSDKLALAIMNLAREIHNAIDLGMEGKVMEMIEESVILLEEILNIVSIKDANF